jgi:hypothetical protein
MVGVNKELSVKTCTIMEKAQIEISLPKGEALLWWVNEETKLQVTPLQVTWKCLRKPLGHGIYHMNTNTNRYVPYIKFNGMVNQ